MSPVDSPSAPFVHRLLDERHHARQLGGSGLRAPSPMAPARTAPCGTR